MFWLIVIIKEIMYWQIFIYMCIYLFFSSSRFTAYEFFSCLTFTKMVPKWESKHRIRQNIIQSSTRTSKKHITNCENLSEQIYLLCGRKFLKKPLHYSSLQIRKCNPVGTRITFLIHSILDTRTNRK